MLTRLCLYCVFMVVFPALSAVFQQGLLISTKENLYEVDHLPKAIEDEKIQDNVSVLAAARENRGPSKATMHTLWGLHH